jgi:hypothetical protein
MLFDPKNMRLSQTLLKSCVKWFMVVSVKSRIAKALRDEKRQQNRRAHLRVDS